MTPNALKMHIGEVRFKHLKNFNPTHFGFNYTVFKFFVFDHENSQIKIKKITKITKKAYLHVPTLPLRESVTGTTPFFIWPKGPSQNLLI
jgi:hypothetical protein